MMTNNFVSHLEQEYEGQKTLFESQTTIVQRFLEGQAQSIAEALIDRIPQVRFLLPDRVVQPALQNSQSESLAIPETAREIKIGGVLQRDVRSATTQRLNELEKSEDPGIALASGLLRYAAAIYMVHDALPAGRTVIYRSLDDEQIPTIPVEDESPESAITQASDAIVEEGNEDERGEVQTPFVPAARIFFLPQWVAFDQDGRLLVGSVSEADAHLQSMQRYVKVLHQALSLAPYISADSEYQRKRYGILGQLINQGRLLASYQTDQIIYKIKERAEKQSLNRGLSVTMPYFDDQDLAMHQSNIEIIPAGRIMFIPAFVVRAVRGEEVKVAQDTRLNASTRRHLLEQLKTLELAFESSQSNEKVSL
jgi:hypothetical protein